MNSNSSNGIFTKSGRHVTVNMNGINGNAISTIPSEYRPNQNVYVPILVLSNSTNRYYLGYITFRSDGSIDGGAMPNYGDTLNEFDTIITTNLKVYGEASWFI